MDGLRPHRCATLFRASWIALLAAGVALSAALPADAQPAAAPGVSVKELVAVLPFRVHSAQPLSHLETSLADLLSSRLEASGQVEVLDEVRARDALLAQAGERTEDTLRRLARDLGADFVVTGSLTELAGRFSLDVRVTPVDSDATARTMVMTAEDEGELLDRVQELSEEVVGIVGAERAGPAIAEVRFEGAPPDLDAGVRSLLQSQPGELYSASRAREDVELLEAYPSVAGARVLTQQTEAGLVVTFQMAQAEELPAPVAEQAGTREIVEVKVRGNKRI